MRATWNVYKLTFDSVSTLTPNPAFIPIFSCSRSATLLMSYRCQKRNYVSLQATRSPFFFWGRVTHNLPILKSVKWVKSGPPSKKKTCQLQLLHGERMLCLKFFRKDTIILRPGHREPCDMGRLLLPHLILCKILEELLKMQVLCRLLLKKCL